MTTIQTYSAFKLPIEILQSLTNTIDDTFITRSSDAQEVQLSNCKKEQNSILDIDNESVNIVRTSTTCNICNVKFETLESQREHFKSDWHKYNLKAITKVN